MPVSIRLRSSATSSRAMGCPSGPINGRLHIARMRKGLSPDMIYFSRLMRVDDCARVRLKSVSVSTHIVRPFQLRRPDYFLLCEPTGICLKGEGPADGVGRGLLTLASFAVLPCALCV